MQTPRQEIQATTIFLRQDMRRNVLPKFKIVEICMAGEVML